MQKNITKKFIILLALLMLIPTGCSRRSTEIVLSEPEMVTTEAEASTDTEPNRASDTSDTSDSDKAKEKTDEEKASEPVKEEAVAFETVMVHVCGAVLCEGVYELPAGSRVVDAIKAAGGFQADADTDFVNQALPLQDGVKIKIPTLEESTTDEAGTTDPAITGGSDVAGISGGTSDSGSSQGQDGDKVNINTASETELCSIPGIGPSRAQSIISYREDNGKFGTIEDIMKVTGIKDKFFSKIKDHITV